MTVILTATLSILAIAGLAWAARAKLRKGLCPICLGVALTWLWMAIARYWGFAVDVTMLATLLGGSVVGLAYQIEKRLPSARSPLLWKTLFIPAGFVAAYGLAAEQWIALAAGLVAALVLAGAFLFSPAPRSSDRAAVEKIEEQMKKCC